MLQRLRIPHIGNYQYDEYYRSDNPLDEVWDRISRYSSKGILSKEFTANIHPEEKENLIEYISTRISQASEFRNASHGQSLITKPLSIYYAMLNLLRANIALCFEIDSDKLHGLSFHVNKDILDSSVSITKGTFKQYLDLKGVKTEIDYTITFREALGHLVEMSLDLREYRNIPTGFTPFQIVAYLDGDLEAYPFDISDEFRSEWKLEYPGISEEYVLNGNKLVYHDEKIIDFNFVRKYVNSKFLTNLNRLDQNQSNVWYLFKENKKTVLPRLAYYHISFFILSNYVRYEPECIQKIIGEKDELLWLLNRLQYYGERYYPQLILNELYNKAIYF